jgi:hypothetical protein
LSYLAFYKKNQKLYLNFLTPELFKGISKFPNSEYEVHQVGLNEAGSQNFSFLAPNTAELAEPQISFKNPRDRRKKNVRSELVF